MKPITIKHLPQLGYYTREWKKAIELYNGPDKEIYIRPLSSDSRSFGSYRRTKELREIFVSALQKRINARCPDGREQFRKYDLDYQSKMWRDYRAIYNKIVNRIVVRQFETKEARERFSHLLTTNDSY